MQIRISFISEQDIVLPIHYNHILQAFIYNNIDGDLARFLHDKGYSKNSRSFKLFTFSRILNRGRKAGRMLNFGKKIEFIVSSPIEEFCKSISNFMLLRDDLNIGGNRVVVEQIQLDKPLANKEEIVVQTLSPIVTYSTLFRLDGSKYTCYFMPNEGDFNRIVSENLIRKYNAFYNADLSFDEGIEIEAINTPRQNLVYYKNIVVKGASGKFIIRGKKELLQLGLDTGFGSKNSQGFGCVRLLKGDLSK